MDRPNLLFPVLTIVSRKRNARRGRDIVWRMVRYGMLRERMWPESVEYSLKLHPRLLVRTSQYDVVAFKTSCFVIRTEKSSDQLGAICLCLQELLFSNLERCDEGTRTSATLQLRTISLLS